MSDLVRCPHALTCTEHLCDHWPTHTARPSCEHPGCPKDDVSARTRTFRKVGVCRPIDSEPPGN